MRYVKSLLYTMILGVLGYSAQMLPKANVAVPADDTPMCNCQTTADCAVYNKNAVCSWDNCAQSGNNTHVCALSDPKPIG